MKPRTVVRENNRTRGRPKVAAFIQLRSPNGHHETFYCTAKKFEDVAKSLGFATRHAIRRRQNLMEVTKPDNPRLFAEMALDEGKIIGARVPLNLVDGWRKPELLDEHREKMLKLLGAVLPRRLYLASLLDEELEAKPLGEEGVHVTKKGEGRPPSSKETEEVEFRFSNKRGKNTTLIVTLRGGIAAAARILELQRSHARQVTKALNEALARGYDKRKLIKLVGVEHAVNRA